MRLQGAAGHVPEVHPRERGGRGDLSCPGRTRHWPRQQGRGVRSTGQRGEMLHATAHGPRDAVVAINDVVYIWTPISMRYE